MIGHAVGVPSMGSGVQAQQVQELLRQKRLSDWRQMQPIYKPRHPNEHPKGAQLV